MNWRRFIMICISLEARDYDFCESQLRKHSFFEFRLDRTSMTLDEIKKLFSMPNKIIAVCRQIKFDDNKRMKILTSAINAGAMFVDIEHDVRVNYLNEIKSELQKNHCKLILSYHNFDETPNEVGLKNIINNCFTLDADIVKIACKSNSETDNALLLSLYKNYPIGKLISIGLGDKGKITRIAGESLGSPFAYASLERGCETAPGQIDFETMKKINSLLK